MALVSRNPAKTHTALERCSPLEGDAIPIGIVTLEDLLQELLEEDGHYEALRILQRARSGLGAELIFEQTKKASSATFLDLPSPTRILETETTIAVCISCLSEQLPEIWIDDKCQYFVTGK